MLDPTTATHPVIGRLAAQGPVDAHHDHPYLVVDGVDGRAHYVRLPPTADGSQFPPRRHRVGECAHGAAKSGSART